MFETTEKPTFFVIASDPAKSGGTRQSILSVIASPLGRGNPAPFCHCEGCPAICPTNGGMAIPQFAGLLRRPATCGTPRPAKAGTF